MPEVYRQASPVALDHQGCPADSRSSTAPPTRLCLWSTTTAFHDVLKAAGCDATLFLIEGGEHNAVDQPGLVPVVLEFLDKHLRGK